MRWAIPSSATLHALVLLALLLRLSPRPALPPDAEPTIQIEYVSRDATQKGAPPEPAAEPAAASAATPPPRDAAAEPTPAPATSTPPSPSPAPPNVNLGNAEDDETALTVTGDNVVETSPDARYRNLPPDYPLGPAGQVPKGSVSLIIHVSLTGTVDDVEIAESSGHETLDRAATDAVRKWHFTVPIKDGIPVVSTFAERFNFIGR